MKKLFIILGCLCPVSFALADQWDKPYTWSYNALADTMEIVYDECETDTSEVLKQLSDFVNDNNAELSVRQLVDKCVEIAGNTTCGASDYSDVETWTTSLGNRDNELCDVIVSTFISENNSYANVDTDADIDEMDLSDGNPVLGDYYKCATYPTGIVRWNKDHKTTCATVFKNNEKEKNRCIKCTNVAGTYEYNVNNPNSKGHCYIEINAWNCTGKGWAHENVNPLGCAKKDMYNTCKLIRKYVDVEKPFTCNPSSILEPGTKVYRSGCAQHGCNHKAKHPIFHIGGDPKCKTRDGRKCMDVSCTLPLSQNTDWRIHYTNGSLIGVARNSACKPLKNVSEWCMPSDRSMPWNTKNNASGCASHLCSVPKGIPSVGGKQSLLDGEKIDYWYKID